MSKEKKNVTLKTEKERRDFAIDLSNHISKYCQEQGRYLNMLSLCVTTSKNQTKRKNLCTSFMCGGGDSKEETSLMLLGGHGKALKKGCEEFSNMVAERLSEEVFDDDEDDECDDDCCKDDEKPGIRMVSGKDAVKALEKILSKMKE